MTEPGRATMMHQLFDTSKDPLCKHCWDKTDTACDVGNNRNDNEKHASKALGNEVPTTLTSPARLPESIPNRRPNNASKECCRTIKTESQMEKIPATVPDRAHPACQLIQAPPARLPQSVPATSKWPTLLLPIKNKRQAHR